MCLNINLASILIFFLPGLSRLCFVPSPFPVGHSLHFVRIYLEKFLFLELLSQKRVITKQTQNINSSLHHTDTFIIGHSHSNISLIRVLKPQLSTNLIYIGVRNQYFVCIDFVQHFSSLNDIIGNTRAATPSYLHWHVFFFKFSKNFTSGLISLIFSLTFLFKGIVI